MLLSQTAQGCGIDFGTSNSTAGWYRPGESNLLPLEQDKTTLPSVVFFNAETDSTSFGRAALADYLEGYEGRLMRSLKSLLGSNLINERTGVAGKSVQFRQLLAQFIAEIKSRAEHSAGRSFEQVVLGRPVYFVDDNPTADQQAEDTLREIARDCGFSEISFQLEPLAAAFHYEQQIQHEQLVLIVDIGGGTSDFSLIRLSPERARLSERRDDILANAGVHIGGTDFDKQLSLAGVLPLFGYGSRLNERLQMPASYYLNLATWHSINSNYSSKIWLELQDVYRDARSKTELQRLLQLIRNKQGHWLAMQVETAKIQLSHQQHYPLDLSEIEADLMADLSRDQFDQAISPLISRIETAIQQLLQDAGIKAEQIDSLFFTGGSSGVPLLRAQIGQLLPQTQIVEGDLFGSIGSGLAVEAARRYG
jgi:hypothetical chaperone protein